MDTRIAVVVPTIRPEKWQDFQKSWEELFYKYHVDLISVWDGEDPQLRYDGGFYQVKGIMGEYSDLIYNFNDGVRNLGFAYVAKYLKDVDVIITLDDDTEPSGNTIEDHLEALNSKVPVSWMNTYSEYTRGFPYNLREEAEVVLSHGIWEGVKDWDAPTQLIKGNPDAFPYIGPITKGVFYPMCGMNLAFKRKMLPYMYFAPMGPKVGIDRFADIWCGIESKRIIDKKGWAVVTGMAEVKHNKASNVFTNLIKEAKGLQMNEEYGKDPYFKLYKSNRIRWEKFINEK